MRNNSKNSFIINKQLKNYKILKKNNIFKNKSKSLGIKLENVSNKLINKNSIYKFKPKHYKFIVRKSTDHTNLKTKLINNISYKNNYNYLMIIGKGGFSKVWVVESKKNKKLYALKVMSKLKILRKKSVNSVLNELNILKNLKDNFIVNIKAAFQDRDNLYLLLKYLKGGDLRFHLCYRKFSEEESKFIMACIILGLEKIHSKEYIHRDIKPENLVFEESGYLRITDFGISRKNNLNNSKETSGTPSYMSPEVLFKKNHSYCTDYYALGIILHEMMYQKRPYNCKTRKEIKDFILSNHLKIKLKNKARNWSIESVIFFNSWVKRNQNDRIGKLGIKELKNHIWFKNFNWNDLKNKKLNPPYKPDWSILKNYYRYATFNSTERNKDLDKYWKNITNKELNSFFEKYEYLKK